MTASRILIVEDELILADDMAQLLRSWGHEVVSIVASGEEAIRKADETSPDLVLMDIMLSGRMDGIEAAGWIKSQIEAAIVYLTAHSKKDLFERAKVTEPFAYLSKPVSPQELEGAVEMALYKHKMEKQLRENEEKFRAVFENSFDAMFLTEADGQVLEANSAAARMLGRSKDELHRIGRNGFVDTTDPRLTSALEERERTGRFMGELHFKRKDGAPFPVEVSSAVFLDSKGQKKACDVIRDITERKLAEEALYESQEKYRMVVENANEAIVVAQNGIARFTNRAAQELVGYPEEVLKSRPFLEFIHPDDREWVEQRYRKRLGGEPVPPSSCFRVVHQDGTVKWVELSGVLIHWEGGPATLNFLSDITERRKIEEELIRLDKLQSVGVLAGGIAHDFNNVLAAILGNISLAKAYSIPGDKIQERLFEAEKSCLRAQALTQQLLAFSSGGAPVKKVADLSRLVKEGCLGALWGSRVGCEFTFPDNLLQAEVDEGQISHVFANLVLNALQAMTDGGAIRVRGCNVTVTEDDGLPLAPGEYVKISLTDQGAGIPEEHIKKIFDPYFTTKNKGSGLGLTTAYAIVKRHGGLITVTSQLDVGTTFHVYVPASDKMAEVQRDLDDPPAFGKGRVLVMDDEESIRNLAKDLLSFLGYEVATAESGERAIDLYMKAKRSSQPFDTVILDLTVPAGMGGIEVVNALRKYDPNVKAIVSSGYSSDPVMAEYRQRGFCGVVAKPYTVSQLSQTLKMVLQGENH